MEGFSRVAPDLQGANRNGSHKKSFCLALKFKLQLLFVVVVVVVILTSLSFD